ncbi:MAG: hypothetical protein CVT70_16850 [Alphaproteobacteria bacterium HGW-Alphaproteobacteria-1]|nr:MAG: hypothetical protein CVT70_16850 [Alphaproteobacteria bacterium HGW-Alphaproteobacteria-1]
MEALLAKSRHQALMGLRHREPGLPDPIQTLRQMIRGMGLRKAFRQGLALRISLKIPGKLAMTHKADLPAPLPHPTRRVGPINRHPMTRQTRRPRMQALLNQTRQRMRRQQRDKKRILQIPASPMQMAQVNRVKQGSQTEAQQHPPLPAMRPRTQARARPLTPVQINPQPRLMALLRREIPDLMRMWHLQVTGQMAWPRVTSLPRVQPGVILRPWINRLTLICPWF